MPRAKTKAPVDLGKLADDANDALSFLYGEGFVEQVDVIRNSITAQGEEFVANMRIQRDINNDLSHRLKASGKGLSG